MSAARPARADTMPLASMLPDLLTPVVPIVLLVIEPLMVPVPLPLFMWMAPPWRLRRMVLLETL